MLSGVAQIVVGHMNWSTGVNGTTPGFLQREGLGPLFRQVVHATGRKERDQGGPARPDRFG